MIINSKESDFEIKERLTIEELKIIDGFENITAIHAERIASMAYEFARLLYESEF